MTPQIQFEVSFVSLLLGIDSKCLIELTLLKLIKWVLKSVNQHELQFRNVHKKKTGLLATS